MGEDYDEGTRRLERRVVLRRRRDFGAAATTTPGAAGSMSEVAYWVRSCALNVCLLVCFLE